MGLGEVLELLADRGESAGLDLVDHTVPKHVNLVAAQLCLDESILPGIVALECEVKLRGHDGRSLPAVERSVSGPPAGEASDCPRRRVLQAQADRVGVVRSYGHVASTRRINDRDAARLPRRGCRQGRMGGRMDALLGSLGQGAFGREPDAGEYEGLEGGITGDTDGLRDELDSARAARGAHVVQRQRNSAAD